MSSIKYSSDLKKVLGMIEKGLNLEVDTLKKFPINPTFGNSFSTDNPSEQVNPYGAKERSQGSVNYVNEYDGENESGYESDNGYNFDNTPEYENNYSSGYDYGMGSEIGYGNGQSNNKGINKQQKSQRIIIEPQNTNIYSKNVSKDRLKEAVVWSEILGPPVSKKRRHK